MKTKQGIRQKLTRLILLITIAALLAASCFSIIFMLNMRSDSRHIAEQDARDRLQELAESRAAIADSMLGFAQNQTLMIAEGIRDALVNAEKYLKGYSEENLPDLPCADGYTPGEYSVHVRAPEAMLTEIRTDSEGNVTYAKLNREASTGGKFTVNQQLYLAGLLSNEFAQIMRFENRDGSYTGFSASYFCFADSGLDILGDPDTQPMICYDGRERGWYKGAVEAWEKGTLTDSGVYWTQPVQDGSGRGISMICAAPVVIDGRVVGVAGSGGLLVEFADMVKSSRIGTSGYSFMVSRETKTVILNPNVTEKTTSYSEVMIKTDLSKSENAELVRLGELISSDRDGHNAETITFDNGEYYVAYAPLENNDWTMVTVMRSDDDLIMATYKELNRKIVLVFILFILLLCVLIAAVFVISRIFSKSFTDPIISLKEGVDLIGRGDLSHKLSIRTGDEIQELGDAFNGMAENLRSYINNLANVTAEKERIGAELNIAAEIQSSMLPSIFPAFPERKEFDIYATMDPAKEVGGDFYDFFLIDRDHLGLVMADVSGKGVPAALFMVVAKSLLKNSAQNGLPPADVLAGVNNQLCQNNKVGMFVTVWLGVYEISTGKLTCANAGHEYPAIGRAEGSFDLFKDRHGFVLGGMEGVKYRGYELTLQPGDRLFLYTDGVPEATDKDNALFGTDRMLEALNRVHSNDCHVLLKNLKRSVDEFAGDAPQFDDITMMVLKRNK